jgi:hypothetical protein
MAARERGHLQPVYPGVSSSQRAIHLLFDPFSSQPSISDDIFGMGNLGRPARMGIAGELASPISGKNQCAL